MSVRQAEGEEIDAILPLIRGYCDFYESAPSDDGLREMARMLIAVPDSEGMLLVAVDDDDRPVGFAAGGWKWSSLRAARVAILEDLFVEPSARGRRHADELIEEFARRARELGAAALLWQTAQDNRRAQAVYERVGAKGELWLEYELELT
jgi:GNAT superfamily N-acetyltransferase